MEKLVEIPLEKAQGFAREFVAGLVPLSEGATVVALVGDLGAGKTTFAKTLAKELGVEEEVTSPTFVLEKIYRLRNQKFARLVHIDAYRLEGAEELPPLGWDEIVADRENLVLIEWADRVKEGIPDSATWIHLEHAPNETRSISWQKKS